MHAAAEISDDNLHTAAQNKHYLSFSE